MPHRPAAPEFGRQRFLGGRPKLRAILVTLACVVLSVVTMALALYPMSAQLEDFSSGAGSALSSAMVFTGITTCCLVAWVKRSRFWGAFCLVFGALSLVGLPAAGITLVRTGRRRSFRLDVVSVAVTVLATTGTAALAYAVVGVPNRASALLWTFVFVTLFSVGCVLWGRVRGTRAALLVSLREQTQAAERAAVAERYSRDSDVARALAEERSMFAEERSALARDMHDGISHRLSIVALHAGAMSSRDDLTPEQLRAAALTVRDAAEGTGVMLREALTALRGISEVPGTAPAAGSARTATSLDARVATARARGADATLRWWDFGQDDLEQSPECAVAIARIVDEILVNAIKYAPDQPLAIDVSVQDGYLRLLTRNPLPAGRPADAIGTGFGMVGLAERAALVGGGARYGETVDAHYQVDVWIPWPGEATP